MPDLAFADADLRKVANSRRRDLLSCATMDIDIAVALNPVNLKSAIDMLRQLDLQPIIPVTWEQILAPGQLERWYIEKQLIALGLQKRTGFAPTVDLLTHIPIDFERLHANRVVKDLGGIHISVASVDDLIDLKRDTGRKIDASDIEALELVKLVDKTKS
jgi:hypothetical protein